jgi:hypothetical protein
MILRRVSYAAVLVALFGFGIEPAKAATFELRSNVDPTNTTGWHIEFDPTQVISPTFVGTPTNGTGLDGVLDFDQVLFKNLNSINIDFVQDRQVAAENFGLRISLRFDIRNESGSAWDDFTLALIDRSREFDSGDALHPGFAHFHALGADGTQAFPPFPKPNPANPSATNRGDLYHLVNGTFATDTTELWTGIGIHQWEEPGETRNFTLRLTPSVVPEPGTLILLVSGLLALGLIRRRMAV